LINGFRFGKKCTFSLGCYFPITKLFEKELKSNVALTCLVVFDRYLIDLLLFKGWFSSLNNDEHSRSFFYFISTIVKLKFILWTSILTRFKHKKF